MVGSHSRITQEAVDITEITQLVVRERESRDLGMWNRMRDCFHEDSEVDISWFKGSGHDFVTASIDMAERGMKAKHRLGPVHVTLNKDRAVATCSGIIDIPTDMDGFPLTLSAHCLMLFRALKRQGTWRLSGFEVIYRRDELVPAIPGHTPVIDPAELKNFRPSYRNLCLALVRTGYTPNHDLAGEDRPESVRAIMEKVFGWAGLPVPD